MEIIVQIYTSIQGMVPSVIQLLSQSVLVAIFLRNNTATQEFEKIKAGQFNEVLPDLLKSGKMTYTELYKAKNFLDIARIADEKYCKNKSFNKDANYDFDWFMNFYEAVGNVSDEKMQDLWARILSQEVDEGNSISLKTIDTIKNMRKSDAELFEKISAYAVTDGNKCYVPSSKEFLNKYGIQYSDILLLNEYGMIYNDATLSFNIVIGEEHRLVLMNNKIAISAKCCNGLAKKLSVGVYPYTSVGNSINKVLNIYMGDDLFLQFCKILANNKEFEFKASRIKSFNNGMLNVEQENLLL